MPIFNNLSTSNTEYVDGKEPHRLAGRSVAHELTHVGAGEKKTRGDFIAADQQVFDRAVEVGNGTLLVKHFTQKYAARMGKRINAVPSATMQKLERLSWPGNVRELENLVQRSVILTSGNTLAVSLPNKPDGAKDAAEVVGNFEEQESIVNILKETKGRVSGPNGAASRLGVQRSTLRDRMRKLGIDAREVRTDLRYSQEAAD